MGCAEGRWRGALAAAAPAFAMAASSPFGLPPPLLPVTRLPVGGAPLPCREGSIFELPEPPRVAAARDAAGDGVRWPTAGLDGAAVVEEDVLGIAAEDLAGLAASEARTTFAAVASSMPAVRLYRVGQRVAAVGWRSVAGVEGGRRKGCG